MKRKTGFGLLVAMALSLTLLLLPTSQAERSRKGSVVPNAPFTSDRTAAAPAINFDRLSPNQDQEPKIQPDAAGLPSVLNSRSALSAALFTSTGGPQVQAEEVSLIANWTAARITMPIADRK